MLRWMFSPNDSWPTPICSERKRDFVPIFAASIWSMDGPPAPRPVKAVPVIRPLSDVKWPLPGPLSARRDVVEAAEHVDVVAHAAERREARRQLVVRARLARESSSARECRCR